MKIIKNKARSFLGNKELGKIIPCRYIASCSLSIQNRQGRECLEILSCEAITDGEIRVGFCYNPIKSKLYYTKGEL